MLKIKANFGMTLIEIMVVILIISVLASIGYPSYQSYIMQSRRGDAINTLRENQIIIEGYKQQNGILPTSGQVSLYTASPTGYYNLAYTRINDNRYQLVATAVISKSQNDDTGCTVITLTSEMDNIYPAQCY